jgi:hypothetical protein
MSKLLSREDEILKRMLKAPPKPHAESKVGRKKKPAEKPAKPTDSRPA